MNPEEVKHRMMAFLDDELSSEERVQFMEQCYSDPALAEELAGYRRLQDVTDSMRLREPEDYEYERMYARVTARIEMQLGFALFGLGLASLTACGIVYLFLSALPLPVKASLALTLTGFFLLAGHVIRVRLRMRRFDRYHGVVR